MLVLQVTDGRSHLLQSTVRGSLGDRCNWVTFCSFIIAVFSSIRTYQTYHGGSFDAVFLELLQENTFVEANSSNQPLEHGYRQGQNSSYCNYVLRFPALLGGGWLSRFRKSLQPFSFDSYCVPATCTLKFLTRNKNQSEPNSDWFVPWYGYP